MHPVQKKILAFLFDRYGETKSKFVPDEAIAGALGLDVQQIQDHLDLLHDSGYLELSKVFGPHYSACLTPLGRTLVREPDYSEGSVTVGDTFHMSGDFRGAILNIKSTLTGVSQNISAIPNADGSAKEELKNLVDQLNEALQKVPQDKVEEAEAVAESAKILVEQASAEKPNRPMIKITGEGLKAAAQNLAAVMPMVATIAAQIVAVVMRSTG